MSLTRLQPLSVNANADFTFANVTSTYFLGNGYFLTGITTGGASIVNGNSNVAVSANSNVTIGVAGTSNVVVITQNTVDVTGNVSANFYTGNGYYLTGITGGGTSYSNTNVAAYLPTYTGNVSANYFIGNGSTLTDITGANVSGNVADAVHAYYADVANSVTGANVSGNVTSAVQSHYANIANSVAGANVSGNVTSAVQSHYANIANSVTGANVSGQVSNALIAGTVYTDAQPNITSVGTLSSLTVSGLITATATGIKAANIQDTSGTVTLVTRYGNQVGDVGVYGNITAGTNGSGNVVATYFVGNGYYLTGITGGTSYSNTNVAAYLPTYTGNVAGNYFIGNGATLTNIPGANVSGNVTSAVQSHYANIANSVTGANVSGQVSNALIAGTVYTNAQPNITSVGNLTSLTVTGNVSANYFIGNGSQLTGLPASYSNTNVAAYLPTYTGNVAGNYFIGNGATLTNITGANVTGYVPNATNANAATTASTVTTAAQPNITSIGTLSNLTVSGDTTISGNLTVNGNTEYTNVTNLYVKDPIIEMGGNANGAPLTSNDGKDRGTLLHYYTSSTVDAFMGWDNSNSEFGFGSNVSISSEVVTWNNYGNIRAGYFIGNGSQLTGLPASYSNTNVAAYLPTYTGNVAGNYFIGNGATLTFITGSSVNGNVTRAVQSHYANIANSVTGANVSGQVSNALIAGTVYTNAQPNITSVGTLTSLTVTGNVSAGNITGATYISGTLTTAAQPNITSVGTLTSLSITGNVSAGNASITGNITAANANITDITAANATITGNVAVGSGTGGSLTGANLISAVYLTGTLTTAAQPNITSVGTLSSLTVTSNVSAGNVKTDNLLYANGTVWNFGGAGAYSNTNVAAYLPTYTGNVSANYFIGNGATLTFITGGNVNGNVTSAVQSHYANIANSVAGANVSGNVTSAVQSHYANIANSVAGANVSGNVTSAVQSHYANIANSVAGANVSGQVGNALIAGTVYTNAQPNITSVGTLSSLSVSGLITATGTGIKVANIQDSTGTIAITTRYNNQTGDVGVYGNIVAGTNGSGNITATYFIGNGSQLTGLPASYSNTNVAAYLPTYTGNVAGNYFIGNGSKLTFITGANVTGYVPLATAANTATSATTAGTVTTAAQPNITSIGTLASLTVTGNISAGNLTGTTYVAGTLTTAAQPNITSVGTLSSLTVSGTATITTGNITTGNFANSVFTKYQEKVVAGGSVSGTITPDAAAGTIYTYTLTGAITLNALTNAVAGTSMTIILTQGGAGSYGLTSTMKFAGGVKSLSTDVGAIDIISVFYDGTNYYAIVSRGYA